MKLSISLPEADVAALDEFARSAGLSSRSAAVRRAIGLLRHPEVEADYAAAWEEWGASGEHAGWEATSADGLSDATR